MNVKLFLKKNACRIDASCTMRGSIPRRTRLPRSTAAGRRDCGRATACTGVDLLMIFFYTIRYERIVHRGVLIGRRRQRENAFRPITRAHVHALLKSNWRRLKRDVYLIR